VERFPSNDDEFDSLIRSETPLSISRAFIRTVLACHVTAARPEVLKQSDVALCVLSVPVDGMGSATGSRLPNSIQNNPMNVTDTTSRTRRPSTLIRHIARKQDTICNAPMTRVSSLPVMSPEPLRLKSTSAWKIMTFTPLNCWLRNANRHMKNDLTMWRFISLRILICKYSKQMR